MKGMPKLAWPPIITSAKVPWTIVVRDYAITVMAWVVLVWLAEHEIWLMVAQVHTLMGGTPDHPVPDWYGWWSRLRPYFVAVAVLVVWLAVWGSAALRRARAYGKLPAPKPLSTTEHAAFMGCDADDVEAWRKLKVAVVHLDDDDRICVEPGGQA